MSEGRDFTAPKDVNKRDAPNNTLFVPLSHFAYSTTRKRPHFACLDNTNNTMVSDSVNGTLDPATGALDSSKPRKYQAHCRRRNNTNTAASMTTMLPALLLVVFLFCIQSVSGTTDYLNSDSVVLITGAAGFLGSELAMALYRTYKPKTIICVDSMDSIVGTTKTEEELSLFEFKRQRAFHLMQTLGKHGVFYRADFRPSIPEYFDVGEVPILDYLVRDYPDITHVVHLAQDATSNQQAVPRKKEDISAGMMETLLEQVLKFENPPHVVYASSYEVYNHLFPSPHNPVPFSEDKPITTPSSLRGASKIIDELLAQAYFETHGIFSVGLRFFCVYGPWGVPGSPLFEMAERAVTLGNVLTAEESDVLDDVRDYVYIDDAVDALMAAMQYRTTDGAPVVINVGTGIGTSLREVAVKMQALFPSDNTNSKDKMKESSSSSATVSYANTDRAKLLLGFEARVSLHDGLVRLLSWHYDRAFPYGGRPDLPSTKNEEDTTKRNYIISQGIASCSPFDKECMRGAPVFPCASECSHETKCTSSFYDDVLVFTRSLTSKCTTVMYTVDLDEGLKAIPSANMAISTHSSSHLEDGCNIAFVSESSELIQTLKKEQGFSVSMTAVEAFIKFTSKSKNPNDKSKVLKHGFWTLVPVSTPSFVTGDEHILDLLPKLSPGLFFGEATTHAIYCDPDVVFRDIPSLLQEAKMQPYRAGTQGATAMLVARKRPAKINAFGDDSISPQATVAVSESIQNAAYRMVHIGVIDDMSGDGYHPLLDSSWVVHTLQKEDSRLFRCDVFGEVVQWDVGTDERAFEFIMGLHDMWSRVIAQDKGMEPWWLGDSVITVPQSYGSSNKDAAAQGRRLEQVDDAGNNEEEPVDDDDNKDAEVAEEGVEVVENVAAARSDKGEDEDAVEEGDEEVQDGEEMDTGTADEDADATDDQGEENKADEGGVQEDGEVNAADVLEMNKDTDDTREQATDDEVEDLDDKDEAFAKEKITGEGKAVGQDGDAVDGAAGQGEDEAKGFLNAGNDRVAVAQGDAVDQNVDEEEEKARAQMESQDEDDESDQDNAGQAQAAARQAESIPDRDHSSYDTWMGILSSTDIQYFVRIVPSSEVGATYLEDYKY